MGYEGRALVIDPDIFAVADVWELLSRDMQGAAIMCRLRNGPKGVFGYYRLQRHAARLRQAAATGAAEEQFDELFAFKRDYMDWMSLKLEPPRDDRRCSRTSGTTSTG